MKFFQCDKPVSEKTKKSADKFLTEYNLTLDKLSEHQKDCLFKHIREKGKAKFLVPFLAVMTVLYVLLIIFYIPLLKSIVVEFAPSAVEVSQEISENKVVIVSPKDKETISTYGLACALIGSGFGSVLCLYLICIGSFIGNLFLLRRKNKFFEAFLPAVAGHKDEPV